VKDLEAGYGDLKIVRGISFNVSKGNMVCLLGGNSSGKTTTMLTISGILKAHKGEILFQHENIANMKPHEIVKRGVVHIPEGRKLFPGLTVLENLELGSLIGDARVNRKSNLERVFAFFPVLRDRISQRAGTLSGGEQQMLAVGRGLMAIPVLLILDEPSLGLAPLLVALVFETIVDIKKEGVTVLLVEQNVYTSLSISDEAFVLENGNITLSGTSKELLNLDEIKRAYLSM